MLLLIEKDDSGFFFLVIVNEICMMYWNKQTKPPNTQTNKNTQAKQCTGKNWKKYSEGVGKIIVKENVELI